MRLSQIPFVGWFILILLTFLFSAAPVVFAGAKGISERECALTEGAEILWDLRTYQWVCCIPRGEDLEDCIPITDKEPLPKTSIKPLPPTGSKKIIIPQNSPEQN